MAEHPPMIALDGVDLIYVTDRGAQMALKDVSLRVASEEFVTLVGRSGSGKSTILSLIAGLLEPTRGTVRLAGAAVRGPSPRVGYMLQQDTLLPWRTILGNVLYGIELRRRVTPEDVERARALLEEVGLAGVEKKRPHELSGGQRQRVALVRTLMTGADVLLLDEPFSALDYTTRLKLQNLILAVMRRYRKTVLLVTHDIAEAIALSDRIYVLGDRPGRIRAHFPVPDDLARKMPLERRHHPAFQAAFQSVWQALDAEEGDA
ncbi:MAG: ABC transporter ATP-binding protein [Hydrogenibacillus schlegelii]|uniref:ABC transporter ATP-binding protein n=1 Tax=Hydrogenibacillus schlegelii TaxID=1484 RepID=A0A947CUL2_HYDSH|nr:ABC transporter ATP-binding protein [Hydrogenibacillus schlegelii]